MSVRRRGPPRREVIVFWLAKIGRKSGVADKPKILNDVDPGLPHLTMVNASLYRVRRRAYWKLIHRGLRKKQGIRIIAIMMKLDVELSDHAEVARVINKVSGAFRPNRVILATNVSKISPELRAAVKGRKGNRYTCLRFQKLLNPKSGSANASSPNAPSQRSVA